MNEDLYPNLEQRLAPLSQGGATPRTGDWSARPSPGQSFKAYRLSQPARQTAARRAIYLSRVGELTESQLIGLRFASDSEVSGLVQETLSKHLDRDDIKKAVENWRPDYFRV